MNCKNAFFVVFVLELYNQLIDAQPVVIGQGAAQATSSQTASGQTFESKTGYYTVDDEHYTVGVVANVGVGTYGASAKNPDGTTSYNVEVLTSGVEVGSGLIGRVGVVDATVNTGPVGVTFGVTADTGLMVKDGIELKLLGVGGSITKSGIQACIFVCFGINWG